MGQVNITLLTNGQQGVDAPDINGLVTPLQTEINGKLDNSNVAANAAIACTKTNGAFSTVNISTSSGNITSATGNITATAGNLTVGGTASVTGVQTNSGGLRLTESAAPTTAENQIALYSKDDDGDTELFMRLEDDGDEIQLTKDGRANVGFGAYETTDASQVGGTGATLTESTVYQANTDGLVIGVCYSAGANVSIVGYAEAGDTTPDVERGNNGSAAGINAGASICFPVSKNEYWSISTPAGAIGAVYFKPLS
jgi:hypothetical protein